MSENKKVPDTIDELEEESLSDSVKVLSPGRLVLRRFFRSRLSIVGLSILIFLFAFCYIGPLFVEYTDTTTFAIPREIKMVTEEHFTGGRKSIYLLRRIQKPCVR